MADHRRGRVWRSGGRHRIARFPVEIDGCARAHHHAPSDWHSDHLRGAPAMKNVVLPFLVGAALAAAQPALAPPAAGTLRDSSGSLHRVIGVAGNFIVDGDLGISNAV